MEGLKEKDLKEGKELMEMIESLPDEEQKQVTVYIGALSDRGMFVKKQTEGGGK